jgi:hypothetical protein
LLIIGVIIFLNGLKCDETAERKCIRQWREREEAEALFEEFEL